MMSAGLMGAARKRAVAEPPAIFGSKLLSWHRADLLVTLASGRASDWGDSSGNGRTFSQGTAGSRPLPGTMGGQASLYFDATRPDYLSLSGSGYGSPSALHVFRYMARNADPAPTSAKSGLDDFGSSAAKSHVPFTDSTVYDHTGGVTRATVGNPAASLAVPCVYESISTGSKFEARLDGTSIYSGASLGVGVPATPWIGGGSHGAYMDGHIGEIVVLNAEASAGERSAWAAYILSRYGLTVT